MKQREILVAPSILSANFTNLAKEIDKCNKSGCDLIHLDVMDGIFVPNITFGPKMVKDIRDITPLPLDVHLMITQPERYIKDFSSAGADIITLHGEASIHLHRSLSAIKDLGKRAGVSLVPSSPVVSIEEILYMVDLVLVMTVNPGFGGQSLIPKALEKVRTLADLREREGYSYKISVDGGVNRGTAEKIRQAGADILVSGSSFFSSKFPEEEVLFLKGYKVV